MVGKNVFIFSLSSIVASILIFIKISFGHAMIAADSLGVRYETLVDHCYKTSTWRETYAGVISPEGDPRDVDIPEDVKKMMLMPPCDKETTRSQKEEQDSLDW